MDRIERTSEKVEELFHQSAAGADGTDREFMQILQRYIFGELCYTGSLDNRMRELVTITVLTVIQALPQLKAHLNACLNVGCTPVELRETVYQCAPFLGFPRTLNAIGVLNEVLADRGVSLPLPRQGTVKDGERYEKGLALQTPVYGDEIRDRYAWLPKPFDEAVPPLPHRALLRGFPHPHRAGPEDPGAADGGAPGRPRRGGGPGEKPRGGSPQDREYERGSGVRPGPRQRLYGHPPPVQRPERLPGAAR